MIDYYICNININCIIFLKMPISYNLLISQINFFIGTNSFLLYIKKINILYIFFICYKNNICNNIIFYYFDYIILEKSA